MSKRILLALAAVFMLCVPAQAQNSFVVACDATWPPFDMLDEGKNVTGYGPEYIRAVAKEIGMTADVRNVAWDGIFAGLGARQYDVICSSVTITEEREKNMAFTLPYFENYQALVVPLNSNISVLSDLKGRTVGGQIGTTGMLYVDRLNREEGLGAIVRTYDEVGLAMEDMRLGRLDAVMCDDRVALYYSDRREGYSEVLRTAFITDEVEYFGFALRKDATDLLARLNEGILAVKEKGIEAELQAQWLDQ